MFGRRKREIAELQDRVRRLVDERDEACSERVTESAINKTLAHQATDADAAYRRVAKQNAELTGLLEPARVQVARLERLEQLGETLPDNVPDLRVALLLERERTAALERARVELQDANEAMCRELADRAAVLAEPAPSRESEAALEHAEVAW